MMKITDLYSHVSKNSEGCWEWTRALNNKGYGVCSILGRQTLAHRASFEISNGAIPKGAAILHSCDNPRCINPAHLRAGSQRENVKDAIKRARHVNPPDTHSNPEWNAKRLAAMPKGEKLHNQSLTEAKAREIFRLHMGHHNVTQISNIVGVPKHVVADVCRGRSWRHLDGIPSLDDLKTGGVRRGVNQFT